MYAFIKNDQVLSITSEGVNDLCEPAPFFAHLSKLLPGEECIVGMLCYGPGEQIGTWLRSLPTIAVPREYQFHREAEIWGENSFAGAYYFHATSARLAELADLAARVQSPELVCDHVIGFIGEISLFSFHDDSHTKCWSLRSSQKSALMLLVKRLELNTKRDPIHK